MNETPAGGSRLFHRGTQEQVRVGDRVRIRRWLRADLHGVVCYVPGISPPHPDLEDEEEGVQDWAIRLDGGLVITYPYIPSQLQPGRDVARVARGAADSLPPTERFS